MGMNNDQPRADTTIPDADLYIDVNQQHDDYNHRFRRVEDSIAELGRRIDRVPVFGRTCHGDEEISAKLDDIEGKLDRVLFILTSGRNIIQAPFTAEDPGPPASPSGHFPPLGRRPPL